MTRKRHNSHRGLATVLGDSTTAEQIGPTLSFQFPSHGHNFKYTTVYMNNGREDWNLCRNPPCSTCSESPRARVFHTDCFRLIKCKIPTLISLSCIWQRDLATYPQQWERRGRGTLKNTDVIAEEDQALVKQRTYLSN